MKGDENITLGDTIEYKRNLFYLFLNIFLYGFLGILFNEESF